VDEIDEVADSHGVNPVAFVVAEGRGDDEDLGEGVSTFEEGGLPNGLLSFLRI
jgi:hypothetical protein